MFCQLKETSRISNKIINAIQKFFKHDDDDCNLPSSFQKYQSLYQLNEITNDEDDATENKVDFLESMLNLTNYSENQNSSTNSWLKACLIAASHNLDLLVLAAVQKFVVLKLSNAVVNKVEPIAWVKINDNKNLTKPVYITSILPLCIASTRDVNSIGIDWTCICVGLSIGSVNFYTERGICIYTEKCSHTSIKSMRFGPSIYSDSQELLILTAENKLIIFEGLSLLTVLKTARNQIAFGEKNLHEISYSLQINSHCLELDHVNKINDIANCGLIKPTNFDQYVTASLSLSGKDTTVSRTSLPTYGNYFCCSKEKFGLFLWHRTEYSSGELIYEVFHHFTSQISNSIPSVGIRSFLGIGVSRKDFLSKKTAVNARSHLVPERSAIFDVERNGERCYMAPAGWPLLAVADSCARVLLIHTKLRKILRLWKGYRGARCAWIESSSSSEMNKNQRFCKTKAKVLFLVIFAPKRGLLEVWSMQNGPRVSAFKVDENGRLLTIESGSRATLMQSTNNSLFNSSYNYKTAAFLSSTGVIYEIKAPFHLSALDNSVSLVYDENFLKLYSITNVLKKSTDNCNNTLNVKKWLILCKNLKTDTGKRRFVEILLNNCNIDGIKFNNQFVKISIDDVYEAITTLYNESIKTKTSNFSLFDCYLQNVKVAIDLFVLIQKLNNVRQTNEKFIVNYDKLSQLFTTCYADFDKLNLQLLRASTIELFGESMFSNLHQTTKMFSLQKFKEQFEFSLENSFTLFDSNLEKKFSDKIMLKSAELDLKTIGHAIYKPFICNNANIDNDLELIFSKIDASIKILVEIYVEFWLDCEWNFDPQKWTFSSLKLIDFLLSKCKNYQDYKSIITIIESKVFDSVNVHAALMLCLQFSYLRIKKIENHLKQSKKMNLDFELNVSKNLKDNSNDFNDLNILVIEEEDVLFSKEAEAINNSSEWFLLLIKNLNMLLYLQLLPEINENFTNKNLKNIKFKEILVKSSLFSKRLTLERLANKGVGYYREQLAVWSVRRVPDTNEFTFFVSGHECPIKLINPKNLLSETTKNLLKALLENMPLSLRPELILCDCCWENVVGWTKDDLRCADKLRMAVRFLEVLKSKPRLQHGLAATIWTTFLKDSFQKLYNIMNEQDFFGKYSTISKDRILKRDVLIVENDLPKYLNYVRYLLEDLKTSTSELNDKSSHEIVHYYEDFIEKFFSYPKVNKRMPVNMSSLSEIAAKHKLVNYHLVVHHQHLTIVMYLITIANISIPPNILFDSVGQMAFFVSFNSHPLIPLGDVDDRTKKRRQTFLQKVVEFVVINGIGFVLNSSEVQNLNLKCGQKKDLLQDQKEHNEHWSLILNLAAEWNLNIDSLKISAIRILYTNGFDNDAENMTFEINNKFALAESLFSVVAGRIKYFLDKKQFLRNKLYRANAAPSSTLDFIDNVSDVFLPKYKTITLNSIQKIIRNIVKQATSHTSIDEEALSCITNSSSVTLKKNEKKLQTLKEYYQICNVIERNLEV